MADTIVAAQRVALSSPSPDAWAAEEGSALRVVVKRNEADLRLIPSGYIKPSSTRGQVRPPPSDGQPSSTPAALSDTPSGFSASDLADPQLADDTHATSMTEQPKKSVGRFAIFSGRKANKLAAAAAVSHPARSRAEDDLEIPDSLSVGGRVNETLSTASTLAQPHVGTPLDLTSTIGSAGSSAIETMQSPVPPFGSQRKLFFPITVLATPVLKKAFTTLPSGQDAHSHASLSLFAHSRGDWKKRVVAISYWTAQTRNVSAVTGEEESLSFGWLHLFKSDGPSGKEVGRMRIGHNSLVGLLDPSTVGGAQAEGRKHVLSFTAGQRPKKRVNEVFGEAEERLVIQMDSEETLQAWVTELKAFIFIKKAELKGVGNAARALKQRGEGLAGDVEILLANLTDSEAKKRSIPATVVEVTEPSPSEESECRRWQEALAVCVGVPGPAARESAQAAALATDSLLQLLTESSKLPTSMTSSSLGSSTAANPLPAIAGTAVNPDDARGPLPLAPVEVSNRRPPPTKRESTMPPSTDLSYSYTFSANASPLPAFGCLRAALIPIAVLAAEVDKKVSGGGGGGLDHVGPFSFLSSGGSSRIKPGVWRRRHLVLTSWNAVTDTRRSTFGCLHVFDAAGPSAREVGRLMLHASTLVGWLDASAANGQEADGRKFVLSVLPKASTTATLDVDGEIDGRLLADMADETTLKVWIAELKKLAFIKRAEAKGLGDLARNAKGKTFGDDLDHALHLLSESTLDAPSTLPAARSGAPTLEFSSPGGRRLSFESIPQVQEPSSAGERSEISASDHSSFQLTFGTRSESSSSLAARLRDLSSVPISRHGSASPSRISRPVLIGSSNADVSRFISRIGKLPHTSETTDFDGSPESTVASPRAPELDYHAFEYMLAQRLHPPDHFSTAGDSVRTHVSAESDAADAHQAEIERLRRVEVELRQQLEIERLRGVEADLRAELDAQRKRRKEEEGRQMQSEYEADGPASGNSDVDPRGPTLRKRSVGSSAYSRSSFPGQSDLSAWDAGRQDRQNSTTTAGSSAHGSEHGAKLSPLSPPVMSLSRQASSKFSSGPSTPLDEEDATSYMRPRSSSRSSYLGSRPTGLAGDYGMAQPLASPVRPATKLSLGPPPAPPPTTLPPPPPVTSAEMSRHFFESGMAHEGGTRSYNRRPSASLETLNERPTGSGRGRAALLRQFVVPPPITVPPPSGPLPVPE